MKQLISKIFILMFTLQFAYGVVGFGLYGYQDFVSTTPGSTSSGDVSVTPSSLENPYMGGFYIYIDAIPFVDFQADFEFAGNTYNFTSSVSDISSEGEFPWARASQYYSLRKKIVGVSVPFLAKAQLYGGAGINMHKTTPPVTVSFIEDAFSSEMDLEAAAGQDFSGSATDELVDFMNDNKISSNGMHLIIGFQAKLLTFNMLANVRYTMAKDVIPGKNGFPSAYVGLGIGI